MNPPMRYAEMQVLRSILMPIVPYVGRNGIYVMRDLKADQKLGITLYIMKPAWNVVYILDALVGGEAISLHVYETGIYLSNYIAYFKLRAIK